MQVTGQTFEATANTVDELVALLQRMDNPHNFEVEFNRDIDMVSVIADCGDDLTILADGQNDLEMIAQAFTAVNPLGKVVAFDHNAWDFTGL